MIKLVVFDMDGLLIDSEPFWRKAQQLAFDAVGVTLSEDDMKQTMGRRIDEVVAHWFHIRPWEGASQKDLEASIIDEVIKLVRQEGQLKDGALATLESIRLKNIPMAVASSSSSEIIDTVVDSLEIRDYFELLYSAEHESHGKPHPGVFITTSEKMNVQQHECLVFEDSPTGVLAAKAAKMICVAVPESSAKTHPFVLTADKIMDSLDEFEVSVLNKLGS